MPASIISLAEFKSAASQQTKNLQENPEPSILTQNSRATAVVEDDVQYQHHQKSLVLLRLIAQGEGDIQHGRLTAQTEVFDQLKQRLIAEQND